MYNPELLEAADVDITDIPYLSLEEIKLFILQYSNYEKEKIKWIGFFGKDEAEEIFNNGSIKYKVNSDRIEDNDVDDDETTTNSDGNNSNEFRDMFRRLHVSPNIVNFGSRRSQSSGNVLD